MFSYFFLFFFLVGEERLLRAVQQPLPKNISEWVNSFFPLFRFFLLSAEEEGESRDTSSLRFAIFANFFFTEQEGVYIWRERSFGRIGKVCLNIFTPYSCFPPENMHKIRGEMGKRRIISLVFSTLLHNRSSRQKHGIFN